MSLLKYNMNEVRGMNDVKCINDVTGRNDVRGRDDVRRMDNLHLYDADKMVIEVFVTVKWHIMFYQTDTKFTNMLNLK